MYGELPAPDAAIAGRLREAGPAFFRAALQALEQQGPELDGIGSAVREATGCKGKALYRPLRLALTGRERGPELAGLMRLVPPTELRRRLAAWAE